MRLRRRPILPLLLWLLWRSQLVKDSVKCIITLIRANFPSGFFEPVCSENLVRIDLLTESPHVGDDGHADNPLLEPGRVAL
jgi:hypothetical protein